MGDSLMQLRRGILLNTPHLATASGDLATFRTDMGAKLKKLTVGIDPAQSGTGNPSPSNVRPITGWTGANVYDDPVYGGLIKWNQLAPAINTTNWLKASNVSSFEVTDGVATVTANTTSTSNTFIRPNVSSVPKGHIVYVCADMKCDNPQSVQKARVLFYESASKNQTLFSSDVSATWQRFESVNTISVNAIQMRFYVSSPSAAYTYYIKNAQIFDLTEMFGEGNEPSTVAEFKRLFPDEYYAYDNTYAEKTVSEVNGDPCVSIPISFGSAGTVYGGELDVLTGVLTVTWVSTTINDEKWNYSSSSGHFASGSSSSLQSKRKPGRTNLKSSAYLTSNASSAASAPDYSIRGNSNVAQIYVKDTRYTDVPSWKAAMGDTQIVYELAEPLIVQLTPEQISALKGTNNIWADTGAVETEYWTHI